MRSQPLQGTLSPGTSYAASPVAQEMEGVGVQAGTGLSASRVDDCRSWSVH